MRIKNTIRSNVINKVHNIRKTDKNSGKAKKKDKIENCSPSKKEKMAHFTHHTI